MKKTNILWVAKFCKGVEIQVLSANIQNKSSTPLGKLSTMYEYQFFQANMQQHFWSLYK